MGIELPKTDSEERGYRIGWPTILLGIVVFLIVWFVLVSSPTAPPAPPAPLS